MENKKAGRPTKYKKEFIEQAYNYALLGAIDADLAIFFGVNVDTIYEWKKRHKQFSDALKSGKEVADSKVAKALYTRAIGYSTKETKLAIDEGQFTDEKEVTKNYPPETTACIFWLKNRQPTKWREKQADESTDASDALKQFVNGVFGVKTDD